MQNTVFIRVHLKINSAVFNGNSRHCFRFLKITFLDSFEFWQAGRCHPKVTKILNNNWTKYFQNTTYKNV